MTPPQPHLPSTTPAQPDGPDRRRFLGYLLGVPALAVAATVALETLPGTGHTDAAGAAVPKPTPTPTPTPTNPGNGTAYEVDITMSQDTVTALSKGNYFLYGFKAVKAGGGGEPLVWFQTATYSTLTKVQWQEDYQAYTSSSTIVAGGQITASFTADIDLDQTLDVTDDKGTGVVMDGGDTQAISILNDTSTPFTTGISQTLSDGSCNPICAFPLYGNQLDVIAPIEKVLLMFSTKPVNTGTVIEQAYSSGILIDLTAASTRKVAFDINKGWSWGGDAWAQSVKPQQDLVPLLIESGSK